jgi:hypothetical protein
MPLVASKLANTRNEPGQFAEYCPRFAAGMWVAARIPWASLRCRYASQYLGLGSNRFGVPANAASRSEPVAAVNPSEPSRSAWAFARPMNPIPIQ